jgi:pseudouridylate synthase
VLVTVPLPEAAQLPRGEAEAAVEEAVRRADEAGVTGAAVTPFVLARVAEITQGRSVQANVALLLNNARVGAAIARAMVEA